MTVYTFEEYEWQDREQIGILTSVSEWLNLQRNTFWSNTRWTFKNNRATKQWLVFKKRYIVVEDDSDDEDDYDGYSLYGNIC